MTAPPPAPLPLPVLLRRAGLDIVEEAVVEGCPRPADAWRPVISARARPTVAVPDDRDDLVAQLNAHWLALATSRGVIGPGGEFLISVGGFASAGVGWTRVRLTDRWDPAGVLGERPGEPEFLALSPDGNRLVAMTTEEYEVWLVVADDVGGRSATAAAEGRPASWRWLEAAVRHSPARPPLRVEVAPPDRLLLRQGGRPVLFGREDRPWQGMYIRQAPGAYRSPVPAVRADLARRLGDARAERWAHWFWDRLTEAGEGPLHAGRWRIGDRLGYPDSYAWWRRVLGTVGEVGAVGEGGQVRHVSWLPSGPPLPVPLRPLSAPDSGRVKAYRKLAREEILPPVLVWWISGLQTDVVLDGHDRLSAALAEFRAPRVLRLSRPRAEADLREEYRDAVESHERLTAKVKAGNPAAAARLGPGLADALDAVEASLAPTRAWPLPGGAAAWDAAVAAASPPEGPPPAGVRT